MSDFSHDCSVLESDVTSINSKVTFQQSSLMPAVQGLRIAHLNCWKSFLLHKEEIFNLLYVFHLDILTLTETWLDDTISDHEVLPDEYSLYRRDKNRHGGGVAILISVIVRNFSSGKIESLQVELYPRSKRSLLLCCAYRPPPKLDFYEHLTLECEKGFSCISKASIVGDLNSNILSPKLTECKLLDSFTNAFGLCEMFKEPTRIAEYTASHLDVFLTNCSFAFTDIFVNLYL